MIFFNQNLWFYKTLQFLININQVLLTNHLKTSKNSHLFKESVVQLDPLILLLLVGKKAKKLEIQGYQLIDLQD